MRAADGAGAQPALPIRAAVAGAFSFRPVCVISGQLLSFRRRIALGTLGWPGTFLPADTQGRCPYL
jgi:hypothetical protein